MKHAQSLLNAANADKAMAFIVAGGVLLVIIMLARAVGRLSKHAVRAAAPAPAPAPKSSGGGRKILLTLGAAGTGLWLWNKHKAGAAAAKAAPAPSPTPRPTITQTAAPHVTQAAHHLLAVNGNVVALYAIGAVVAIALGVQALRSRS